MDNQEENLIIRHEGVGLLIVFAPLLLLAFAGSMLQMEVNLIWWLPVELLIAFAFFGFLFRKPSKFVFWAKTQSLEIEYRLGGLFKKNESVPFQEIESIQSVTRLVGDNDPAVELELKLRNQRQIVLKSAAPDWDSTFCLGLSGALEPKEVEGFRHRIAAFTGAKNLGFYRPSPFFGK